MRVHVVPDPKLMFIGMQRKSPSGSSGFVYSWATAGSPVLESDKSNGNSWKCCLKLGALTNVN